MPPHVCQTPPELAAEALRATELLRGRQIARVWSPQPGQLGIEFTDGSWLFVDRRDVGLELSITEGAG